VCVRAWLTGAFAGVFWIDDFEVYYFTTGSSLILGAIVLAAIVAFFLPVSEASEHNVCHMK
jgi:hypothetical protein